MGRQSLSDPIEWRWARVAVCRASTGHSTSGKPQRALQSRGRWTIYSEFRYAPDKSHKESITRARKGGHRNAYAHFYRDRRVQSHVFVTTVFRGPIIRPDRSRNPVPASPALSGCAYRPLPHVIYLHAPKPHWRGRLVRRRPRRASGKRASRALPGPCSDCPLFWPWRGIWGRCARCAWGCCVYPSTPPPFPTADLRQRTQEKPRQVSPPAMDARISPSSKSMTGY